MLMCLSFPHARLRSMTPLDRITPALRSAWLPLALLLLALSTVFVFAGDRGYFYRGVVHNWVSSHYLTIAVNLSPEHDFQRFMRRFIDDDGVTRYQPYNRFPIGGYASTKLATLPFGGNPSAQLYAARILMLLFFTVAAVLAYLSLCRLTSNRWIALTAALLAFSSYYLLYYNDMTTSDTMPDLFGVMLTFHGMVVFVQEGRFRQLLVKTCVALLLGWHVLALLLPFVIFGLARDLLRARSAAATSTPPPPPPPPVLCQVKRASSAPFRSRYLLLGIAALGFGLSLLAFNFTMEYAALKGETPLTELPSFQVMLMHTGVDSQGNAEEVPARAWRPFLEGQFESILRMFIPYTLLGGGDAHETPTWLPKGLTVVLGVVLSGACLIASMFARQKMLFATLASFGFFWALPMRHFTALHEFERIYYIGLPLVFFSITLLLARRVTNRNGVIAAASVIALLLFAVSSFQMSRVGHSAETAQAARAAGQDMLTIREATAGELITVLRIGGDYEDFTAWQGYAGHAINYYLNTSPIRYVYLPAVDGGFVVMRERLDTDALLTPQNQYFFLYDRAGLEAWYDAVFRTAASTDPPAREDFDVYFDDRTVYYLKEPCDGADTPTRFFLHVHPIDENDLPDDRRQYGFDNLDFYFEERGLLFGDKCLENVVLPQYDISKINTGRVGQAWGAVHYFHPPKLILESQSITSNEPVARSEFDVYATEGKLYYLKEPCERADTDARFFLHVVPEAVDDLPSDRRQHGFDNLDFAFGERGVLFDDRCLVSVDLPQYGIARITTGQFDGAGRIWEVEFAPDARE